MSIQIHPNSINQPNSRQQVRQNLINQQNQPQLQMQTFPVLENSQQPRIRLNIASNIETTQLINYLQSRRTIIPYVPISKYKYFTQILMFFTCFIEMVFFQCTFIHAIWFLWYPILGFHRHSINNPRLRFVGQLINFLFWIAINCYVFSHHKVGLFPMVFLIGNMDYYFIGFNLIFTYFCYLSYILWNWCADFRLKIIIRKLANRKKQLLESQMARFLQNEKKYHQNFSTQSNQQSIERMQKQNHTQKEQKNMCPVCLTLLKRQQDFMGKDLQVVRLFCSHRFHYGCLRSWIQTEQQKCPVCRQQMFK